jgi:hypothetical protein
MIREADYNIVGGFGAEYRGIVQYYLLAGDVQRLHRLRHTAFAARRPAFRVSPVLQGGPALSMRGSASSDLAVSRG